MVRLHDLEEFVADHLRRGLPITWPAARPSLSVIPIEEFVAEFCVQVHKSNRGVVSDKMQLALAFAQSGYGFSKLSHRPFASDDRVGTRSELARSRGWDLLGSSSSRITRIGRADAARRSEPATDQVARAPALAEAGEAHRFLSTGPPGKVMLVP
jgi:hypothetical protein